MSLLKVLKYPDSRLLTRSKEIHVFDAKLHKLLDDMADTMYEVKGVGLAAPQVGENIRVFVIDIEWPEGDKKLMEFVNPKILSKDGKIVFEEGCLSLPGLSEEVVRADHVQMTYQDRHGNEHELEAEGFLAVAIQHESDHLDGVLFVDRLSPLKRRLVKRKVQKLIPFDEAAPSEHSVGRL